MTCPTSPLIFKSRRSGSTAGHVAPVSTGAQQAVAGGADTQGEPAAVLIRPFRAYALCFPSRRKGAPATVMFGTLSVQRSGVRASFDGIYKSPANAMLAWSMALENGAFIARVIVSADPDFTPPVRHG